MKNKAVSLLLAVIFCMGLLTVPALAAETVTATPTASTVLVNGKTVAFDAYTINGNNYFKLRDLAYTLSGTAKQFDVGWDGANNAISLTSGKAYTATGGEMTAKGAGSKTAAPTSSKIYLDGKEVTFTAYNIDGNNYFKLRDIGLTFDFSVEWDGTKNTIVIDTGKGYVAETTNNTVTTVKPTRLATSMDEITDVKAGTELYEQMRVLCNLKALYIYNDGTFKPDQNVTYGEFIEMLTFTLYTSNATNGLREQKADEHWAMPYFDRIIKGKTFQTVFNDSSKLNDSITKLHLIGLASKAFYLDRSPAIIAEMNLTPYEKVAEILSNVNDLDIKSFNDAEETYIFNAGYIGWLLPDNNNNLYPNKLMTRAEAMKYLSLIPY